MPVLAAGVLGVGALPGADWVALRERVPGDEASAEKEPQLPVAVVDWLAVQVAEQAEPNVLTVVIQAAQLFPRAGSFQVVTAQPAGGSAPKAVGPFPGGVA